MNPNQTITTRAVLTFGDGHGLKSSFSIPRARLNKTTDEVRASMQAMLDTGALDFRVIGSVSVAKAARLVKTIRTRIV